MAKRDGWDEYKNLVLREIQENGRRFERLWNKMAEVEKSQTDFQTRVASDISGLKVKATVIGGVAGMIGTGIISAAISLIK